MSSRSQTIKKELDGITISVYLSLLAIGWLMITASNVGIMEDNEFSLIDVLFSKDSLWLLVAIIAFFSCLVIDWKVWNSLSWIIYGVGIILLIGVLFFGTELKGSKSWYSIFNMSFQPSEFAKFSTALGVAGYLSLSNTSVTSLKNTITFLGIIILPSFFIMLQPDAGSALVFTSFFLVFYRAGAPGAYYLIGFFLFFILIMSLMFNPIYIISVLIILGMSFISLSYKNPFIVFGFTALTALFVLVFLINGYAAITLAILTIIYIAFATFTGFKLKWPNVVLASVLIFVGALLSFSSNWAYENVLKPHQQDRINVWLNPEKCDPQGSYYNVNQSKIAIGSGGLYGKGFLNGEMTKLNYVPEQATDFIVSTLGEEQGFVGILGVILLIGILLIRIIVIAERSNNKFISYFAYCVFGIIFFQSFINIGMSMGFMPVIGIPLPFISKGGSALLMVSIMIGILVKMDMERRRI